MVVEHHNHPMGILHDLNAVDVMTEQGNQAGQR